MLYSLFKEEFLVLFNKIDSLKKRSPTTFGIALLESKARDQAFHLEGLLRLLIRNKAVPKKKIKRLEKILKQTKAFEDCMGKMDESLALEKALQHQQKKVDANPLVRSQSAVLYTLTEKTFGSEQWVKEQLEKLHFLHSWNTKKTAKVVRVCLCEELEKLTEKTCTEILPKIEKSKLTYDLMELYFHEFRRMLRWIPIYTQTLQELFELSPFSLEDVSTKEKFILQKYKRNIFTELTSSRPLITIDRYGYYYFSHSIAIAGQIKDTIEMYYKMKDLHLRTELDSDKYKKEMVQVIVDFLESGALWRLYDSLK